VKFFCMFLVVCACLVPTTSLASTEYTGKLDANLVASKASHLYRFRPVEQELVKALPEAVGPNDRITGVSIHAWSYGSEKVKVSVISVLPEKGSPYLYIDANRDGHFTKDERFVFADDPKDNDDPNEIYSQDVVVNFPITGSFYKTYPIRFQVIRTNRELDSPSPDASKKAFYPSPVLYLLCSGAAIPKGVLNVDGRALNMTFSLDSQLAISLNSGEMGIDCNQDGLTRGGFFGYEWRTLSDKTEIFRSGKAYFSIDSVSMKDGLIIAKPHDAMEYVRVEYEKGSSIPEFSYKDLGGVDHSTKEIKSDYLLLIFWNSTGEPSHNAISYLKNNAALLRERDIQVLGMNWNSKKIQTPAQLVADLPSVKEYVRSKELSWLQASQQSILDITNNRFHIVALPSMILVDKNRSIVAFSWKWEVIDEAVKNIPGGKKN